MFNEKRRIAWCEKPSHLVSEALWVGPEFHPWFCPLLPQGRFFSWYYSPVSSINVWVLIVSSGTGEHFVLGTIYNDGDDRCHLPNRKSAPVYRIHLTRSIRAYAVANYHHRPWRPWGRGPCRAAQGPGFPVQPQMNSTMPSCPGSSVGPLGFQPSCHTFSCVGVFPSEHLFCFLIQLYGSRARSVFILHCITKQSVSKKYIPITDT